MPKALVDYGQSAFKRRRALDQQHRAKERVRGVFEKCRDCRESYRVGTLDYTGICKFCKAEYVDAETPDELERRHRFMPEATYYYPVRRSLR